tara:strand:- start:7983 stop:8303 length:321 start_codon:yes stop_codon:yes gene_type:complete
MAKSAEIKEIDNNGKWRWLVVSSNGRRISRSPKYYGSKEELNVSLNRVSQADGGDFYKDNRGDWRWRVMVEVDGVNVNHAMSSQGYSNLSDCERCAEITRTAVTNR